MNETLRLALLKEHARDKRLTFINYLWIWTAIAAVFFLVYTYLGEDFIKTFLDSILSEMNHPYLRFALPGAFLLWIFYGIMHIVRIGQRKKMINDLSEKLNQGAKATQILENREYKIKIPALKVNFHLCPVDFCMFTLDCEPTKKYHLPVPYGYIPDLKNVLSGVSLETLYGHLNEIYSDEEIVYDPADDIPVKTVNEFKSFLTEQLKDEVTSIEQKRKSSSLMNLITRILIVVITLGVMGYTLYFRNPDVQIDQNTIFMLVGGAIGVFYFIYFIVIRPRQVKQANAINAPGMAHTADFQFKNNIMGEMVKFISPKAEYIMHGHIGYEELMASGMFNEAAYDITGNDLIIGRHRGVPFQFCDLTVQVNSKMTYENEEPDTAFYGQFFVARFNKSFSTPVYIIPKKGFSGLMDNQISGYTYHTGEKVQLEDPEFMDMFKVYATDQIEARYLLTPSLMERIKELAKRTKGDYYITFYNNKITVANNSGRNNFEIKENKSLLKNDYKVMTDFYQELCDQFALIDDLKLNIKIWR